MILKGFIMVFGFIVINVVNIGSNDVLLFISTFLYYYGLEKLASDCLNFTKPFLHMFGYHIKLTNK